MTATLVLLPSVKEWSDIALGALRKINVGKEANSTPTDLVIYSAPFTHPASIEVHIPLLSNLGEIGILTGKMLATEHKLVGLKLQIRDDLHNLNLPIGVPTPSEIEDLSKDWISKFTRHAFAVLALRVKLLSQIE